LGLGAAVVIRRRRRRSRPSTSTGRRCGRRSPVTQETVSPRGGSQAVRPARRDEAALLGEVLADAFAEDPVFAWLVPPQPRGRDNRMRTFFTSMSRSYLRQGKPCYLSGDASAAALWAAPGAWAMPLSQVILEAVPNGLATRMLREVLAGADTDGVPAYLESSSERNLPLYERNGFRVVGELRALGHGPTIWRMWREPPPRT